MHTHPEVPLGALAMLLMSSDPWPIAGDAGKAALEAFADAEAKCRGFAGWLDAFHKLPPEQWPPQPDDAEVERAARAWCAQTDTPFERLTPRGRERCLQDFRMVLAAARDTQARTEKERTK